MLDNSWGLGQGRVMLGLGLCRSGLVLLVDSRGSELFYCSGQDLLVLM